MDAARCGELEKIALEVRKDVVRMLGVARAGGFSKAIGIVDVLIYLYWEYMRIFPGERNRRDRDMFVLGKSSAIPALYACLARRGFFGREELWSYSRLGAMLQGYPDIRTPGIDAPWCSRGGGIGLACGLSLAFCMEGAPSRVICLIDDEDMMTGVAWESIMSVPSDKSGNLILLVDANIAEERMVRGLESFGWIVSRADGNDFLSIDTIFGEFDYGVGSPNAVFLSTKSCDLVNRDMREDKEGAPLSKDDVDMVISLLESGIQSMEYK
jgi:transketolase